MNAGKAAAAAVLFAVSLAASSSHSLAFSQLSICARTAVCATGARTRLEAEPNDKHSGRRAFASRAAAAAAFAAATALEFPSPAFSELANAPADPSIPAAVAGDEPGAAVASSSKPDKDGVVLYTTKSGLQYIDLLPGSGPTPKYGQLCSFSYVGYVKLPASSANPSVNTSLQKFDDDRAYLTKHGNGRIVSGLDEGLHNMRVGGKRRIIIPPKLGYVASGLGPLPSGPIGRYKLNKLLDQMIELRGGNLVFDVVLRSAFDDEADQGYYEDSSLSPEDFLTLRNNIQKAGNEAIAKGPNSGVVGGEI